MATSEMSQFPSEVLNLPAISHIPQHESEDEYDEEEDPQHMEEVHEDIRLGLGGLNEDDCNDNSTGYYDDDIRESSLGNPDSNMPNGIHNQYSENVSETSQSYTNNEVLNNHNIGPNWSDNSDHSGNFSRQKSIIEMSPTHFPINMQGIVSQSEESESENPHTANYCDDVDRNRNARNNYLNHIDQNEYLSAETTDSQLKLLYDARGRELDKLSEELEELKKNSSEQISNLRHEICILKTEKENAQLNMGNLNIILSENEKRIRSLLGDLKEREEKLETFEKENKKLKMKVDIAEGTISNLEHHISELQNIESIAKGRQAQEDFLKKFKTSHDEQLAELNRRFKNASSKAESYEQEVNMLQEELRILRQSKEISLKEKSEIIRDLTSSYEEAKRQIQLLISTKPNLISEQEISSKNELLKELQKVSDELEEAKGNLKSYDTLAKLGFFQCVVSPEDSSGQLNLPKALTFEESLSIPKVSSNKANKSDPKIIDENLRTQFYQILYKNKKLRDENQKLNEILTHKDNQIKIAKSELKSLKGDEKLHTNSSVKLSQNRLILEENTLLKKELLYFFEHVDKLTEKGDKMTAEVCNFLNKNQSSFSTVDLDSQTHALRTVIQNFGETIEKFSKFHFTAWEELKNENLQLMSKTFPVIDNINSLIDSLKNMQNDWKFKNINDSSYAISLKNLLDTFIVNSKQLKDEVDEYFQKSIQLKNELHSLRVNLLRAQREKEKLKNTIEMFESNEKKKEEERNQMLEACKEQYLKSQENVICKMKSEYDTLISSCKNKIESLSCKLAEMQENYEKLQYEKMKHAEACNVETIKEKDSIIEILKTNLAESIERIKEMESKYKMKIEDLESKLNTPKNNDDLSISDNVVLYEEREKNKQLLIENQKLKKLIKLKYDNERGNHINEEKSSDVEIQMNDQVSSGEDSRENKTSDTDFGGFKKLYEDQKAQNEKQKYSHEKELEDIKNNLVSERDKEIEQLKENISELFSKLNTIKETSASKLNNIMKENSEILMKSSQQIEDLTNKIIHLNLEKEVLVKDFNKYMSECNIEKEKYQKQSQDLIQQCTNQKAKYENLKTKYRTFCSKSATREEKIKKNGRDENNRLVKEVNEWLQSRTSLLEERICRVIDNLKGFPEKAKVQFTLKYYIDELEEIRQCLTKMYVEYGTDYS
ncbi:Centrosomal protein [Armadillidium vulgare]|nr:Centrosomal protein [Armadillidium vulgare]